jgi:hypothetical protein
MIAAGAGGGCARAGRVGGDGLARPENPNGGEDAEATPVVAQAQELLVNSSEMLASLFTVAS